MRKKRLIWLKLDNAAKIYPASRRKNWTNVFRLSATLKDEIDKAVVSSALKVTLERFPSFNVRLRKGLFWYYLQQLDKEPQIKSEASYPLTWMSSGELRSCAFRVIVHDKRIAFEFFHSITDGTGAMTFFKSFLAEYIEQKYGEKIENANGILSRKENCSDEELEDSFLKHSGPVSADRRERTAWKIRGTAEPTGFQHLTCFTVDTATVLEKAHVYNVTLTAFLTAAMMMAIQNLQLERVTEQKKRKPVRVLIPVDLRKLFGSKTLRNFAMYTTPEILPQLGYYSFEEICKCVRSRMELDITPKIMCMKIATNVSSERILAVRLMPLFIKNMVMKAVFNAVGECKSCLSLSNLGNIELPSNMAEHIERLDFILGVQAAAPHNCGVLSFGGKLNINFIRNIIEPDLEKHFFLVLRDMGIEAQVQTNLSAKDGE